MSTPRPIRERFWPKVKKTETCWLWTAGTFHGYGRFRVGSQMRFAHRVAYELEVGPIPQGLLIDHACHVRSCVNPAHLRLATQKQNLENRKGPQRNSVSGVRGVSPTPNGRWQASVRHQNRSYSKRFADFDEACAYVVELRNQFFTHNDSDRRPANV